MRISSINIPAGLCLKGMDLNDAEDEPTLWLEAWLQEGTLT